MCFGGKVKLVEVHMGRFTDHHTQDFYDERHQTIFAAMINLYDQHRPVDLLTLTIISKITHKIIATFIERFDFFQ